MILVFGAAGTCGASVVRALVRRGAQVRGFVRSEARESVAHTAGVVETIVGDVRDKTSVENALRGVTGVYYLAPKFVADEAAIGRMVVKAVGCSEARSFVYQSVMHSNARAMSHHEAKREVEEALYESQLDFTILQTARMMHNIVTAWNKIIKTRIYEEPFSSDVQIADVDYDDVAEVAALALTTPGYGRATFELCAEGMLNRHQRADLLSVVLDRHISAGNNSASDWLTAARISDPYEAEARTRMFAYYDRFGFQGGNAFVLRNLLGRKPASYLDFLKRTEARLGR